MPQYIDRSALREKYIQEMVKAVFADAVGPRIAEQVREIKFRGKTLHIAVKSAVWRQELHMQRPAIAARLNEKAGEQIVDDIRITA